MRLATGAGLAFVVPLAILFRVILADRAIADATEGVRSLSALVAANPNPASVQGLISGAGRPVTVFLPGRKPLGVPAQRTPADRLVGTVTRPIGELARVPHRLAGARGGNPQPAYPVISGHRPGGWPGSWVGLL